MTIPGSTGARRVNNDVRILVVEYKGQHLYTDAEEKRAVGEVWASRSNGKCRFVMPTQGDFSSIIKATM